VEVPPGPPPSSSTTTGLPRSRSSHVCQCGHWPRNLSGCSCAKTVHARIRAQNLCTKSIVHNCGREDGGFCAREALVDFIAYTLCKINDLEQSYAVELFSVTSVCTRIRACALRRARGFVHAHDGLNRLRYHELRASGLTNE
jgi:hypothetical protein